MTTATASVRRSLPAIASPGPALGLILLASALLRLVDLDQLSYWFDEAYTAEIVGYGLGHVIDTVPETEFTPPLYYLLGWVWGSVAGTEEAALRSLSALFGIGTVAVTYLAGRALVDTRTGLAAAALSALSPVLVWYSREARAYALLALLSAAGLLFLALALRERKDRRVLAAWAAASALALCTHYFAVFTVVPQAAWLLWVRRDRAAAVAVAVVAAAGLALLPLALAQHDTALLGFLEGTPLSDRLRGLALGFPGGVFADVPPDRFPFEAIPFAAALVLAPLGIRGLDPEARNGAALALGLAAIAILVPVVLALLGFDYVTLRNFVGAAPPLFVALGAGLLAPGVRRAGAVVLAAILACSLLAVNRSYSDESLQRTDWRLVDDWLGERDPERVIVTHWPGQPPLELHRDAVMLGIDDEVPVSELVVIMHFGGDPVPPTPAFEELPREYVEGLEVARFRSERPVPMTFLEIAEAASFAGFAVLDRPDGQGRL